MSSIFNVLNSELFQIMAIIVIAFQLVVEVVFFGWKVSDRADGFVESLKSILDSKPLSIVLVSMLLVTAIGSHVMLWIHPAETFAALFLSAVLMGISASVTVTGYKNKYRSA